MLRTEAFAALVSDPLRCHECDKPLYSGIRLGDYTLHRRCFDAVVRRIKAAAKDAGLL